MNRRSFLQSLGIATATLYLRFAPASVTAAKLDRELPKPDEFQCRTDDSVYQNGLVYDQFLYKNQKLTAVQLLAQLPRRKERRYDGEFI